MDYDYKIQNARVEDVSLTWADGIFTFVICLDYGGSKQGFGTYALDHSPLHKTPPYTRRPSIITGAVIMGLIDALKVDSWEKIKGQHVRAIIEDGLVRGVGHILLDRWFRIDTCFRQIRQIENLLEIEKKADIGELWQKSPAPILDIEVTNGLD